MRAAVLAAAVVLTAAACGTADVAETTPAPTPPTVTSATADAVPSSTPDLERRLVAATKANEVAEAIALIEAGADVNAKDAIEDSAFLYAGAEGLNDILVATLEHGADVHSTNRFGGTALIPAAEHGHVETVRILIAAGVPVNHVNDPGWTALLEAVVYGDGSARYVDVVGQLLDAGADPSIRDARGRTALQHAQARGQHDIVALLTAAGAN
ncbi:ankyrin repeat domain-containing protein [Rhodococcus hoagii]|nr:ankyrin repeat domain-containing protein [Prescottella equi]NKZ88674.1 ankyrin repeat domain-containing protein [Prescottella equi]NKZ93759.1 ankyrin repeat domain-containing protein [Prescottella equi]NKZ93765.1 ankyrin repeat domain-containing protein [Prescottella equi]NKZ93776.1 ankyrin repeat domain-containing protein [Prescottella equi]